MDNREQFDAWHKSWIPQFDGELRYCDVNMQLFDAWLACDEQKDKEISELKELLTKALDERDHFYKLANKDHEWTK